VRGRGRRFIDLVPRGRRQAVLAAFTLQLATDRGLAGVRAPLSDLGVRGPLGSMALGLRRRRTASGRWLLVATLDPP
jgi:hypothetical protein